MRAAAHFLATKYSLSLVAAALAVLFVPPSLGAMRFALVGCCRLKPLLKCSQYPPCCS
jgi:hypothetical protein